MSTTKLTPSAKVPEPELAPTSPHIQDRFGHRLKTLRLSKGFTQSELAVALGIDRSHISDLERGRKSISLPLLEIIAIGFELTLSELLQDL